MSKTIVKLIIKAKQASPKPPIGSILGQKGINVSDFCKKFNALTSNFLNGAEIPTTIYIKKNKTFEINIKAPTLSFLFRTFLNIKKGSKDGSFVCCFNKKILNKIYKIKKNDINAFYKKKIKNVIIGSAKSLGLIYKNNKKKIKKNNKQNEENNKN